MKTMKVTRRTLLGQCSLLALAVAGLGAAPAPSAHAATVEPVVLVVGDSLSAEYGLARGKGWVALLTQRVTKERPEATVVNASISGDTTAGGRSRLPALLKLHRPTHVIVELGGNDALRGLPLNTTRDNLATMVRASRDAGAQVVVVGMQLPPNYGRQYGNDFASLFASVAKEHSATLVPFLLKGVADVPNAEALFQPDRIHPNEGAQAAMADNVWPVLRPLLK